MNTCRSCGQPIRWAKTSNGKSIPLDAEPHKFAGNILLHDDGTCVVMPKEEARNCPEPLYRSHFASCANAKKHRKPKK
jgi:hypothetical protein